MSRALSDVVGDVSGGTSPQYNAALRCLSVASSTDLTGASTTDAGSFASARLNIVAATIDQVIDYRPIESVSFAGYCALLQQRDLITADADRRIRGFLIEELEVELAELDVEDRARVRRELVVTSHAWCSALATAARVLAMPGEAVAALGDQVAEVVAEELLDVQSPALSFLSRRVVAGVVTRVLSGLLGVDALQVSIHACKMLSIVVCPEPSAHAAVTDAARDIVADELKGTAKAAFHKWLEVTFGFEVADVHRAFRDAVALAEPRMEPEADEAADADESPSPPPGSGSGSDSDSDLDLDLNSGR